MELPSFCNNFFCNFLTGNPANRALAQKLTYPTTNKIVQLFGVSFFILFSTATAAQVYSTQVLKQDVAKFLANHYSQEQHERLDIKVGNLDSRLRLKPCTTAIDFTLQDPTGLGGNISVQARCPGPQGWAIHVPAQTMIYRHIPVAARTIARGEQLTESHLTDNLVNVSSVRQGYELNKSNIIGKEAKRNIGQGEPFKTSNLDAPTAIQRGENVTLQAQVGSIKVVSSGIALADGRLGQKIRVRNSSSERIVTGIVLNQGLVKIL